MKNKRNIFHRLISKILPITHTYRILDLDYIEKCSRKLADKVLLEYEPDVVIGIADGGSYPALKVSCCLECEMDTMHISRYKSQVLVLHDVPDPTKVFLPFLASLRNLITTKPEPVLLKGTTSKNFDGKKLLLIDDDCSTGDTFKLAKDFLSKNNPQNIKTATFFKFGDYKPDFFVSESHSHYILYPWRRASPFYDDCLKEMSESGLLLD